MNTSYMMHVWSRLTHFVFRVFTPTFEAYKSGNVIPVDIVNSTRIETVSKGWS